MRTGRLMIYAGGGFCACVAAFYLFRYKVSSGIMSSSFYNEAMETVRQHKGAIYLLGQPITAMKAKYNSSFRDSEKTEIKVYLSGPKSNGILFCSLLPGTDADDRKIKTIQLQIGRDDSKRLVVQ